MSIRNKSTTKKEADKENPADGIDNAAFAGYETERFVFLRGLNPYLIFGVIFLMLTIVTGYATSGLLPVFFMFLMLCLIAYSVFLWYKKQLTYERAVFLIMLAGVLLRIVYVLNTPVSVRQHDVGDGTGDYRQLDYILHFVNQWALPNTYISQYYHPPLHHLISAVWVRLQMVFNIDIERGIESIQYLTAFYSSCFMVVAHRIFIRLKLKKQFLLAATALIALHPTMIILSGSINNDMLAVLFYASALLWMMKWLVEQNIKNTVYLALCVGLGMMAKIGNATLAFVIAPFFLAKLAEEKGWLPTVKLAAKLLLFGLISIPAGMWHAVRNLRAFGQPFGYVLMQEVGGWLYRGDIPLVSRIFSFPLSQLLSGPYVSVRSDYNLPVYTIKCSLFGEWAYAPPLDILASILVALNIIIILMSLAAMIYMMIAESRQERRMLCWCWSVQIVSFVLFYIQNPFTCAMDFRYIVPTLICGAGFICLASQKIAAERTGLWRKIRFLVFTPITLFIALSTSFYIMI